MHLRTIDTFRFALALTLAGCGPGADGGAEPLRLATVAAALSTPTVDHFQPAQNAEFLYSEKVTVPQSFRAPSAVSVLGRVPVNAGASNAIASGAIVAVYLEALTHVNYGAYHMLFDETSDCGPAIPEWPGVSTSYGPCLDIRVSWFSDKLLCVVKRIKAEHPEINAIFLDDYGPGFMGYHTQAQYCAARDALGKAFDNLRTNGPPLLYFVNAMWHTQYCGGWPDKTRHGLAGALGVWEHHSVGDGPWADDAFGNSQFLTDSQGNGGTLAITYDSATTNYYGAKKWVGFIAQQGVYDGPGVAVRPAHDIGLHLGASPPMPPPTDGDSAAPPTALEKPSIPTGFTVTAGNGQAQLEWAVNPSGDVVDRYQVYLNDQPLELNVTEHRYIASALNNGTAYAFRVSAHNAQGYGGWTAAISATPTEATAMPAGAANDSPSLEPVPMSHVAGGCSSAPASLWILASAGVLLRRRAPRRHLQG